MESDNTSVRLSNPVHDFNSLNLRLNPEPLLDRIEVFLRGEKEIQYEDKEGQMVSARMKIGLKKANDNGIQSIYNWIAGAINVQVVQGNFPIDNHGYSIMYEDYKQFFRQDFTDYIINNCYEFEIDDNEIEGVIDFTMNLVVPYMSRLIGNEERRNYTETLRSEDRTVSNDTQKPKMMGLFS
jgi:hypothetical protein